MRKDVYYQRGAADPILSDSVVLEIVRQYAPDATTVAYIDETGGEARTYAVDDNITLKVQRPHRLRMSTSLEREAFFLRQLEGRPGISVPRVLGYGRNDDVEYTCMTRMPGVPVYKAALSPDARRAMLFELGKTLRGIHSIDQKPFVKSGLFPCDDSGDLAERLRMRACGKIDRIAGASPSQKEDAIKRVDLELSHITATGQFVALHTNPAITHTFVDEHTCCFTGVIDFGDAYIGHPIFDMWYWGVDDKEHLLAGYTAVSTVDDEFMTIFNAVNGIDGMIDELNNTCGKKKYEYGWE